jgi:hypothetical protein
MEKFGCLSVPAAALGVAALFRNWEWVWALVPFWVRPLVEVFK